MTCRTYIITGITNKVKQKKSAVKNTADFFIKRLDKMIAVWYTL